MEKKGLKFCVAAYDRTGNNNGAELRARLCKALGVA
jgi:hypothetical protein